MAESKFSVCSCLIDGESIGCNENALAVLELIRRHGALASAVLCAFDLLSNVAPNFPFGQMMELARPRCRSGKVTRHASIAVAF
jgi:hypothetical protein